MVRDKRSKFIAAKVNLNENIFSENKEELINAIPESIKSKRDYQRNSWTWKFADVVPLKNNDGVEEFIYGHLVKSRFESVNVVDGDKTESYQIPKPVANTGIFLYHIKNEVLIFEEAQLDRNEFIIAFQELVLRNNYKIGEVVINFIPDKTEIVKEIEAIDILTKIEFDFIPPNMIEKKTYKGLNDIIKDENATRMKASFENDNGLNKDGEFIGEGIEMVSNTYGTVKAYGHDLVPRSKRKGNKKVQKRFFSKDSIQQRKLSTTDVDELKSRLKDFAYDMIKLLL
jgi:hypothetical protein